MKILKLNLYTDKLEENKDFFLHAMGLELLSETRDSFSVRVGWSELSFSRSEKSLTYHYCFLIPRNQLIEAFEWMKKRTPILEVDKGRHIQRFDSWNADSFYFHDGSGNLAECIARHDLENESPDDFSPSGLLGLNEIGLPTLDISATDKQLTDLLGTSSWKGNMHRFGTHGDQEGLFLLPNYQIKKTWFPTSEKIQPAPFEATIDHLGQEKVVTYREGKITLL